MSTEVAEPAPTFTHLSQLTFDPHNVRVHNPRNIGAIADNMHEVGAARSIVTDEHGVILAGNGVVEAAAQAGIEEVVSVHVTGNQLVAVVRSGLTPAQKTKLALADNRTSDLSHFDQAKLGQLVIQDGELLKGLWYEKEQEKLLEATYVVLDAEGKQAEAALQLAPAPAQEQRFGPVPPHVPQLLPAEPSARAAALWSGLPNYVTTSTEPWKSILVHFADTDAYHEFAQLVQQPRMTAQTRFIWYPEAERGSAIPNRCADESELSDLHR